MDLEAITAQLPSDPKVQLRNVDIGLLDPWKDGDWISVVPTLMHRYSPEDAFILVSKNISTVFGPRARIVTYRVLDDIAKPTPIDIWYQFYKESDFGGDSSDFLEKEYVKATMRRLGDKIEIIDETGSIMILNPRLEKNLDEKFFFFKFFSQQKKSPFVPRCAEPLVVIYV
jgi:hypothetical protein